MRRVRATSFAVAGLLATTTVAAAQAAQAAPTVPERSVDRAPRQVAVDRVVIGVATAPRWLVRVQAGAWANPHLRVRSHPGWPGGQPGDVIGAIRYPHSENAVCQIYDGAELHVWGRKSSTWVKLDRSSPSWVWDGGLVEHEPARPCCPRAGRSDADCEEKKRDNKEVRR
ncbi:hypothetical protein [Actinomadura fulvescens]